MKIKKFSKRTHTIYFLLFPGRFSIHAQRRGKGAVDAHYYLRESNCACLMEGVLKHPK